MGGSPWEVGKERKSDRDRLEHEASCRVEREILARHQVVIVPALGLIGQLPPGVLISR